MRMTSCLPVLHPTPICRTSIAAPNYLSFPSLYEGFGLPVLEAMNCGVPVACSNISSIPEVIGDAGILFDPYDDEAIADAMRRLLTDPGLLKDCRERGLARARKFAWSATAALTLKVLREARRGRCVMPADPHMIGIAGPFMLGKVRDSRLSDEAILRDESGGSHIGRLLP